MPTVRPLTASKGPSQGGSYVVVLGSGFSQRSSTLEYLYCRFNLTRVAAIFVSESEVHCYAPDGAPGYVDVEVTNNDLDYTRSGVQYEYQSVLVTAVEPASGLSSGGTRVYVTGENFFEPGTKGLFCRFGSSLNQPASWHSINRISCESPSYESAGLVEVSIIADLAVYSSKASWHFYEDPVVESLYPWVGGTMGGTVVQVYGSGFLSSTHSFCKFGHLVVMAVRKSDSMLLGASAAMSAAGAVAADMAMDD